MPLRKFVENEDGLIGAAIVIIIAMLVLIWFLSFITTNFVPIVVILILAITLSLIIKNVLAPGQDFGVVRGVGGVAREIGREGIGLYESAKSEFKRRR